MNRVSNAIRDGIFRKFRNLTINLNNCPEELWNKKYGGDYYWQQFFHAVAGTCGMLDENMEPAKFPIPYEIVYLRDTASKPDSNLVPHGKELMKETMDIAKEYLNEYFDKLNDDMLFEKVVFLGREMDFFDKLETISSHISYHVGVMDAALRDNGAEASM